MALRTRRSVVNSLKEKARNRFNASVSEVDSEDVWQRATLAAAVVGGEYTHVSEQLDALGRFLESDPRAQVIDIERDIR